MIMYTLLVILSTMPHNTYGAFSFKKITNFFSRTPFEKIIKRRFTIPNNGTLRIENNKGNIHIKTDNNTADVLLTAKKHASTEESLQHITIIDQHSGSNLLIQTMFTDELTKGYVDYFIVVPPTVRMHLHTADGSIQILQAYNSVTAKTSSGNIVIGNAQDTVHAHIEQHGSITIQQAKGNVDAATDKGSIIVNDSYKSVHATVGNGMITLHAQEIPSTDGISLTCQSGNITLYTQNNIDTDIIAKTGNGSFISDHYITIKPFTTKLNRSAWKRFKQEIEGTIGSGEATIELTTQSGNIKILHEKTN